MSTDLASPYRSSTRRALAHRLRVLGVIASAEFKLKYSGSALGYVWSVLKPLALFTLLYLVFGRIFKLNELSPYYAASLLVGIVLYTFFADATIARALVGRRSRVDHPEARRFRGIIIPTAATLTAAITLGDQLLRRLRVRRVQADHAPAQLAAHSAPPRRAVRFTLGVALILATLFVRLRDLAQVWELALTLFFYAIADHLSGRLPSSVGAARSRSSTRSRR